jgi:hypothetical protein
VLKIFALHYVSLNCAYNDNNEHIIGITMAEVIRGGRVLLLSKNAKQLVQDVLSIRECRPK